MALTDAQLKKRVRGKTTDSTTELPDSQILYYAGRDGGDGDTSYTDNIVDSVLDVAGVIADCWMYLARDDRYMSETQGSVSVSQPTALRNAAYWLGQSLRSGAGSATVTVGSVDRLDLMQPIVDDLAVDEEFLA